MGWLPDHRSPADPEPGQAKTARTGRPGGATGNSGKVSEPAKTAGLGAEEWSRRFNSKDGLMAHVPNTEWALEFGKLRLVKTAAT